MSGWAREWLKLAETRRRNPVGNNGYMTVLNNLTAL